MPKLITRDAPGYAGHLISASNKHSFDISQNFEECISGSNLRPCGDGSRCYHRLDSCWEAACLNADCFEDHVLISDSITELDKTQVNVTVFNDTYRTRANNSHSQLVATP